MTYESDTPTRKMPLREIEIQKIIKERDGKISQQEAERIYNETTGRRGLRGQLESRYTPMLITHGSPLLECVLARRKVRRTKQGKRFHPIYGYRGCKLLPVKIGFTVVPNEDGTGETTTPVTVISNKDVCKYLRRIK